MQQINNQDSLMDKERDSKYFYISYLLYAISIVVIVVSIFGFESFLRYNTTYRLVRIFAIYVVPLQILGLVFTGIGLSKTLKFDNERNKKLGRIGLIYGLTGFVVFIFLWAFLIWIAVQD